MKREEIQIRDPFVLVENGIYYLIGTTGSDPWGRGSDLQLFVSRDLEEFEKRGVLVTDGSLSSYKNIWAPELHEYRGKYYLIVSADRKDVGGVDRRAENNRQRQKQRNRNRSSG